MRHSAALDSDVRSDRSGTPYQVIGLSGSGQASGMLPAEVAGPSGLPARRRFAADVREGLTASPKHVPCEYLYDELGSALFDAICELPWYPLARAEMALIARHARAIVQSVAPLDRIVELGAGNGQKLATLLAQAEPAFSRPIAVELIDVSAAALARASTALSAFDRARVSTHCTSYETGLGLIGAGPTPDAHTLALLLGSNIGNFSPTAAEALLRHIRAVLAPGDALLLGTDLVKPKGDMLLAYDDPLGVTAAFNRNLLVRINTELGADFDVSAFTHRVRWDREQECIESCLVSSRLQQVRIPAAELHLTLDRNERIWTERSYKYQADAVRRMLARCGFHPVAQWIGEPAFGLTLAQVASAR